MKVLQIFTREPDDYLRVLSSGWSAETVTEVILDQGPVDYLELLDLIFDHDRVICWP